LFLYMKCEIREGVSILMAIPAIYPQDEAHQNN
jgi:hypothetical protein